MPHPCAGKLSLHVRLSLLLSCWMTVSLAMADGDWEITTESERALARGIEWLAANQGPEGNWEAEDLGLVSMGALAMLSAGHLPDRGPYGKNVQRALDYVIRHERPNGLLNVAESGHDMYNHGLSAFVLGQAYGMTNDSRIGPVLDRALKLIAQTQCGDGGWEYQARRASAGHDLSLAVMQAKALRSAVDSGLEVSPQVIELAIRGVRRYYTPKGCAYGDSEEIQKQHPGQFTYQAGGGHASLAMAAAGVVCLQEFAQYDDWRIEKNMAVVSAAIHEKLQPGEAGRRELVLSVRRLHVVLRGAGALPGWRTALEGVLPHSARCAGSLPARTTVRSMATAGSKIESPASSILPRRPVSCLLSPIVTCRFFRKVASIASGKSFNRPNDVVSRTMVCCCWNRGRPRAGRDSSAQPPPVQGGGVGGHGLSA